MKFPSLLSVTRNPCLKFFEIMTLTGDSYAHLTNSHKQNFCGKFNFIFNGVIISLKFECLWAESQGFLNQSQKDDFKNQNVQPDSTRLM